MKKITLTRLIATIGCLMAAASLSVFLFMYSDRTEPEMAMDATAAENPRIVTPKTMGSYGELMFAYVGEHNYLYNLDDETTPLVRQPVKELLYASDDSVLYLTSVERSEEHAGRESSIKELMVGDTGVQLNTIATVTVDPCWSSNDEVIYFVDDMDPTALRTFEPLTSTTEVTAYFDGNITGLRISSDGLLVTLQNSGEQLFVPLSKQLLPPNFQAQGMRITVCEQYDLLLGPEGTLLYHWQGIDQAVQISDHCLTAISHQDNEIYYIEQTETGTTLNVFYVSEEMHQQLAELEEGMLPQLTGDADYAFMLDEQGVVYRYDIQTSTVAPYCFIDLTQVRVPMISLFDYRLMVYDLAAEPDQTFCYAIPANHAFTEAEAAENLEKAAALREMNSDRLQYPEKSFLTMGSMGEAVRLLQDQLLRCGYMTAAPNGFYDVVTMEAVRRLQHDEGLPETGVADRALQTMLEQELPAAAARRPLALGDQGFDVRALQARLYTLGYLLQRPTGMMDEATMEALRHFCWQRSMEPEDTASAELISAVHDPKAEPCYTYLPLSVGVECDQAYRLNTRLKTLGYTNELPAPDVTEGTLAAVQLYCTVNGAEWQGEITEDLQAKIFAEDAAVCPADQAPGQDGSNVSATPGQTITDKELKVLRKWLTKSFAINHTDRQAVKRLQMRLIRMGYMPEGSASMIYDATTADAVRRFQQEHDIPADGVPSKKTLMSIFEIHNAELSSD